MKSLFLAATMAATTLLAMDPALSAELAGVKLPDLVEVAGKKLALNGMGIRKATFLKVQVYVAGLYLETPSKSPADIKASSQFKRVDMHFLREVPATKIRGTWKENFEKFCKENCAALMPELNRLNSVMVDFKQGDTMTYTFYPDHVEVAIKGEKKLTIQSLPLAQILLTSWLGPDAPDEDLAKGLLGKS